MQHLAGPRFCTAFMAGPGTDGTGGAQPCFAQAFLPVTKGPRLFFFPLEGI